MWQGKEVETEVVAFRSDVIDCYKSLTGSFQDNGPFPKSLFTKTWVPYLKLDS